MSTKQIVEGAAMELAKWDQAANASGMGNVSPDMVDRIKQAANHRIVTDRADEARKTYSRAFEQWRLNGFRD